MYVRTAVWHTRLQDKMLSLEVLASIQDLPDTKGPQLSNIMNRWMPQVHMDSHGHFFHLNLTDWQLSVAEHGLHRKPGGPVTLERIHHNRQSSPESPCQAADASWRLQGFKQKLFTTETVIDSGSPNWKKHTRKSSDSKTRCIRHIPKNKKCHKSCDFLPRILKVQLLGPRNMSKSSW